jgi:hypothetical protein
VSRSRVIATAVLTLLLAGGMRYALSPASFAIARPGEFNTGMAIVILGYVLYPLLALLAVGLLVVAFMIFVGAAIERRRQRSPR